MARLSRAPTKSVLLFTTENIYAVETHNSVKESFVL